MRDACVLLLDTSVEGWAVVYANESWQQWTGCERNTALGRPLAQLLRAAGSGRPAMDWAEIQRAAAGGCTQLGGVFGG